MGGIESVFCIVFGDSLWFLYPKANITFHASFEIISGVCSSNSTRSRFDCWGFSKIQIVKFDFLVGPICIVIRSDRFDTFQFTEKETGSRGSNRFSYGTYGSIIPWYTLEREM